MILLDTHVLVWWLSDPEKLSLKVRKLLNSAQNEGEIAISAISIWEIALLVKKKRLELTIDAAIWIEKAIALPFLKIIPIDHHIAFKSVYLPEPFHEDPADRLIVATAMMQNLMLITRDSRIRAYGVVKTNW